MNAEQLLTHFDRLADAPDAIPRLRRFILDLAVRGKPVGRVRGMSGDASLTWPTRLLVGYTPKHC